MLTSLIGLMLPPIIDLINKHYAGDDLKEIRFLYALAVCFVVGLLMDGLVSNFTYTLPALEIAERIATQVLTIFSMAQISYQMAYKNSAIRATILLK